MPVSSQSNCVSRTSSLKASDLSGDISAGKFVRDLLSILCLAGLAYLSLAFFWGKFSRAEVFFAECAREMLIAGNYITPLYHSHAFFDKPIFVYWLIIAMFKLLGTNHFASRLPSIIASLITTTCTAAATSYLYNRRNGSRRQIGLLSASMLGSAFMYLSFSSLCMSDMFLVMFDNLSLILIYAGIIIPEKRSLNWWLASVSMGFAFLTKGPVGVVLPVMAAVIYLVLTGNLKLIKLKHLLLACITIAAIATPWFYSAYLANGIWSLIYFFVHENVQRFAGSSYDAHKPGWYMILGFFLGFAPWSILLPPALLAFCREIKKHSDLSAGLSAVSKTLSRLPQELSGELFLWLWIFIAVGFFCISRGQCDYYTLPAYPAAAILAAHYAGRWKYSFVLTLPATAIFLSTILFAIVILPQINRLEPIDKIAGIIKGGPDNLRVGADKAVASWIDEILFQSGKDPQRLDDLNQMEEFIAQDNPALLIVPLDKYKLLLANSKSVLKEIPDTSKKANGLDSALRADRGGRTDVIARGWQTIACYPVVTHSLTPSYVMRRHGHVADSLPLIVVTNIRKLQKLKF